VGKHKSVPTKKQELTDAVRLRSGGEEDVEELVVNTPSKKEQPRMKEIKSGVNA